MGNSKKHIKQLFKFGSLVVALIVIGWVYVLAYPSFLFAYEKEFDNFTIYSDIPIGPEVDSVIAEAKLWLEPIDIYDPASEIDIYLCSTEEQFGKISRFTLRQNFVMGFNLPELNNCMINVFAINKFGELTNGSPPYHTREGSVAHVITHELMHQYLADRYGSISSRSLPTWKTEGYCEYGSNFVRAKSDNVSLSARLSVYFDDSQWNSTAQIHRGHYLWGIMIEYLVTVRGLSFKEIMDESIERNAVYSEMVQRLSEEEVI